MFIDRNAFNYNCCWCHKMLPFYLFISKMPINRATLQRSLYQCTLPVSWISESFSNKLLAVIGKIYLTVKTKQMYVPFSLGERSLHYFYVTCSYGNGVEKGVHERDRILCNIFWSNYLKVAIFRSFNGRNSKLEKCIIPVVIQTTKLINSHKIGLREIWQNNIMK